MHSLAEEANAWRACLGMYGCICFSLLSLQAICSRLALYTGELFFIGYQMDKKPACCWYAGLDKAGALQFDVRVPLQVSHPSPELMCSRHSNPYSRDRPPKTYLITHDMLVLRAM